MKKSIQISLVILMLLIGIFDLYFNKPIGYTNYLDYLNLRWLQYISFFILILIMFLIIFEKDYNFKVINIFKKICLSLEGLISFFFSLIDRTIFYKEGVNEFYSAYNIIFPILILIMVIFFFSLNYFFDKKLKK